MYYYIYKITNTINQNFYIGRRASKVSPELDSYYGSGKRIKLAIKKYGIENFNKEVVLLCQTELELIQAEKRIVTEELTNNPNCYNLAIGGHGGYTFYKNRVIRHSEETKRKISLANKGRKRPDLSERNRISNYWIGKYRTEEDKLKKSFAAKKRINEGSSDFVKSVECPHCGKVGQLANMKRWHFDRCKTIS